MLTIVSWLNDLDFFYAAPLAPEYFLGPFYLIPLYLIYLIVKPQSKEDQIFSLNNRLTFESVAGRIEALGLVNKKDYTKYIEIVKGYYADNRINDAELERIEGFITKSYFGRFEHRWTPIKKIDSIFILIAIWSALSIAAFISIQFQSYKYQIEISLEDMLYGMLLSIIPGILGAFLVLGFVSAFVSMINVFFPMRGSVVRARITTEEVLQAFVPRPTKKFMRNYNDRTSSNNDYWDEVDLEDFWDID